MGRHRKEPGHEVFRPAMPELMFDSDAAERPGTGGHRPGTGGHRPGTDGHPPGTDGHQPEAESRRPEVAPSEYVKQVDCATCGTTKQLASATPYLYCDYCGALVDYDFRQAYADA